MFHQLALLPTNHHAQRAQDDGQQLLAHCQVKFMVDAVILTAGTGIYHDDSMPSNFLLATKYADP